MAARDDYPELAEAIRSIPISRRIEGYVNEAFDEIDFLRQWIATLAERRPTDTREAKPTRK